MRLRPVLSSVVSAIATLTVLAACSVPRDREARVLTDVPTPSAPRATVDAAAPVIMRRLYFVRNDASLLEGVELGVAAPGGAIQVLDALRQGPSADQQRNLNTKVPPSVRFDIRVLKEPGTDGEIIVSLTGDLLKNFSNSVLQLMYQQIVWSLSEIDVGFPNVRFDVNNKAIPVRDKLEGEAVTRADFIELRNVVTTTAPTTTLPTPTAPVATPTSAPPPSLAPATR